MTPRIIHVAGTMGSGKTTLIRSLLAKGEVDSIMQPPRKLPLGHSLYIKGCPDIFVVGAYDDGLQSSGCDTFKNIVPVYELIEKMWGGDTIVIYEGLFMMNHTRGVELQRKTKVVTVLRLTTPLAVCLEGVMVRRKAQGNTDEFTPKHLEQNDIRARNYAFKMAKAGAEVIKTSRVDGLGHLLRIVGGDRS